MTDWNSQIDNQISLIKNEDNRAIVQQYRIWLDGKQRSERTIVERMRTITKMSNIINKPYKEITSDDIEKYLLSPDFIYRVYTKKEQQIIDDGGKVKITKINHTSTDKYKNDIRTFFKWLYGYVFKDKKFRKKNEYPEVVDSIEFVNKRTKKNSDDLLSEEEILKLIKAADGNIRNQTLIAVMYDTLARLNELLTLDESDVHRDEYGFYIRIRDENAKTFGRAIRMKYSVPYLNLYLPSTLRVGEPLFKSRERNRLSPTQTRTILKKCAEDTNDAKITNKRIYPHLIRHSKATAMCQDYKEQTVKRLGGWTPDSNQFDTYIHLKDEDTDREQLKVMNLLPEDEEPYVSPLEPKTCPNCQELNPASNETYCSKCGFPLSGEIPIEPVYEIKQRELEEEITKLKAESESHKLYQQYLDDRKKYEDRLEKLRFMLEIRTQNKEFASSEKEIEKINGYIESIDEEIFSIEIQLKKMEAEYNDGEYRGSSPTPISIGK